VSGIASARVHAVAAGTHEMIRIDAAWIDVEPLDMRAGVHGDLTGAVSSFGHGVNTNGVAE